jgi:threonine aldolase
MKEFGVCFDSMSLCFSKGLGAPIGSILVGSKEFIKHARWVRKSIGGGLRQAGVVTAAARVAVEETFLGGKLKASHERAKKVAELWTSAGGKLSQPVETNMLWLDLNASNIKPEEVSEVGKEFGLCLFADRIIVHYQVSDEAIERLGQVFNKLLELGQQRKETGELVTAQGGNMYSVKKTE